MTTAVQVQYRRGTASQVAAFSGASGEMVIDSTNNRVVVQDGSTAGGFPAAKLSEVVTSVVSTGGSTINQSSGVVSIGEPGGLLNKFRNGTMDVWQRGTSSLTAGTSGAYTADGWIVLPTGASVTAAQAGGRLVSKNSLQVTGATSVTDVAIKQRIESLIAAALCSQTATVQARVYNNTGGSITPTLTVKHAASQDSWTSPATDVNAVNLQSCANGQWTQIAYTFAAGASSYNGVEISFDFGNNFSSGSKTIQIAECDIRATPGVTVGLNSSPPPPELRPIAIEYGFCQRYYRDTHNVAALAGAIAISTTQIYPNSFTFSPPMRSAPTVTPYSFLGTANSWSDSTNNSDVAVTPNNVTAGGMLQFTGSGFTAGRGYFGSYTASAEL